MKLPQIAVGIILLFFWSLRVRAQDIGYVDLTGSIPRESSRHPRTLGGGCGGSPHSNGAPKPEVTASLVSLDKSLYRIGEEATFEIKVLNSGKKTIIVPWTPHRGDLEPADLNSPYKYRVGVVMLVFRDPEGHEFSVAETLYGSPKIPGTLRALRPGQWFTVRGRKRIDLYQKDWGQREFEESGSVDAQASGYYRQDRGSYSPVNGGSDSQICISLGSQKANQLDVVLEHR